MGTYIEADKFKHLLGNTFVFDLEYIGTSCNLNDCFIWDMSFVHILTGTVF